MKKAILGIAFMSLCTGFAYTTYAQSKAAAAPATQEETVNIPDPPKFEADDVNKGIGDFVSLIKEYAPAIKAHDSAKMVEFGTKMQAWQQNVGSWAVHLTPEEQGKFQQYMQKVGTALQPTPTMAPAATESTPDTPDGE